MIRYLKQDEKIKSRKLWEEVFKEDSQAYLDFYYSDRTRRNKILVAEEGGSVLAMLHRNPYDVVVKDRIWRVDYIAGVATLPKQRHQGYMRQLLSRSFADMYMEKMGFCFLIPADPAIYHPFEFTYICNQPQVILNEKGRLKLDPRACMDNGDECVQTARFVERCLDKQYEVYTKRDEEYYHSLCREMRSTDGDVILLKTKDEREKIAGVFAFYGANQSEQREFICVPEFQKEIAFPKPFVMGRIINLEQFIQVIRLKEDSPINEMELLIEVKDGQIHQNEGVFKWHLDKNGSSLIPADANSTVHPKFSMGIGDMAAWLFGYGAPSISDGREAMIQCIRPLQGVYFDEIV